MKKLMILVMIFGLLSASADGQVFFNDEVPPSGNQALVRAALEGNFALAEKLLDQGADPNSYDDGRGTALLYAAYWGYLPLVEKLLDRGADPNIACSMSGGTPLMNAARMGNRQVYQLLLSRGANPNARDHEGMRAQDYLLKARGMDAMGSNELVRAASYYYCVIKSSHWLLVR